MGLSSGNEDCESEDVDSARKQSKRKGEEKPEASQRGLSGSNGERTKRQKTL